MWFAFIFKCFHVTTRGNSVTQLHGDITFVHYCAKICNNTMIINPVHYICSVTTNSKETQMWYRVSRAEQRPSSAFYTAAVGTWEDLGNLWEPVGTCGNLGEPGRTWGTWEILGMCPNDVFFNVPFLSQLLWSLGAGATVDTWHFKDKKIFFHQI